MNKKINLLKYLYSTTAMLLVFFCITFVLVNVYTNYNKFEKESLILKKNYIENKKKTLKAGVEHFVDLVKYNKSKIEKEKRIALKQRIDLAYNVTKNLYDEYKNTKSTEEIKKIIIEALRTIRFENDGYFYIANLNGDIALYADKPELEGKNLLEKKSSKGVYALREIKSLINENAEGYYTYMWSKPNIKDKEFEKISYVKLFKEFDWIIGTGMYTEDIQKEIQQYILSNIKQMEFNYDEKNYIFIGQWDGLALSHPATGKNMYDIQDKNGLYLVRELIKKAKEGGGFTEYIMPSLKDEKHSQKLSYTQSIAEWKWYMGAGVYIDDINEEILALKNEMKQELLTTTLITILISILMMLLFVYIHFRLNSKLKKDFEIFVEFLNSVLKTNKKIDREKIKIQEFDVMAEHANIMLEEKINLENYLEQYKQIVSSSQDFLALLDNNYIFLAANETYAKYFQKDLKDIVGHSAEELFGKEKFENTVKALEDRAFSGEAFEVEHWLDFPVGKRFVQTHYNPIIKKGEQNAEIVVISSRDITKLKDSENMLTFMAHHDILTRLPNRTLLKDRITHAIANAKRLEKKVAICFIDLDNFKKINDSYGHSYGDDVLLQVAERIKGYIRDSDTLSRIGGDEFVLLLENVNDESEIEKTILKIQELLEEKFIVKEKKFFISASIGISLYPKDGDDEEILIKNADIAMYSAKDAGKNTYKFFTKVMSLASFEMVNIESQLKDAIKEEQFVVYYQPQVNLKTKEVIGLEALVRWNHPTDGIILPIKFIKHAEVTKMIVQIGEFVLKQSCKDLVKLQKENNFNGNISVNVSGVQIEHSDFIKTLKKVIDLSKITPDKLELEITESTIMNDPTMWIEVLSKIQESGINIAIDDFGTGYSSLNYLQKLPIDKLKIDMSFVRYIPKDESACSIANSIISLSKSMKMNTIAEGIESKEQEEFLAKNGCNEGQGYLYAKPMNIEDLVKWLDNYDQ